MVTRSARSSEDETKQQKLFTQAERSRAADELLVLRALGDFQKRGKVLVERSLPLDRLRGALRRQTEQSGTSEMSDEQFAEILSALGARVQRVPTFVAKHPFRVIIPAELAEQAVLSLGSTETDSVS